SIDNSGYSLTTIQIKRRRAKPVFFLYQFTKVWQHFYELKTKPSKGFKSTKWLRHFVLWY
ncbi:MAG: hypothetical protein ACK5C4_02370, partial [Pseudanabaena sp.]